MNTRPQSPTTPSVGWAWMIILPLLLLTGFSVAGILRGRERVVQQAREDAQALIPRLVRFAAQDLESYFETANPPPHWLASDSQDSAVVRRPLSSPWVGQARFLNAGQWILPRIYPALPSPPDWIRQLPEAQRHAWYRAQQLASGLSNAAVALQAWRSLAESASAEAQPEARLQWIRLMPAEERDRALPEFIRTLPDTATTDTGMPLLPVALFEWLRGQDGAAPNSQFLMGALERCVLRCPSVLTAPLLDRVEQSAVVKEASQRARLEELQQLWAEDERVRQILPLWEQSQTDPKVPRSLWIRRGDLTESNQVLAALVPGSNAPSRILFLHGPALKRSLGSALTSLKALVPPFASVELTLLGESFGMDDQKRADFASPESLGSQEGVIRVAGASIPIQVDLRLTNLPLLLRQQTQQAWTVGLGVGVALCVALAGLMAMRRAFKHQRALYEAQSNFVSSVSHELRAPIASISLMVENLEKADASDAALARTYTPLMLQECRRLAGVVENMLALARLERGASGTDRDWVDVRALTRSVIATMQPLAAQAQVSMEVQDRALTSSDAFVDGRSLERALVNLVDNAIKHSPAGALILITLRDGQGRIAIDVQDQGPGIPPEDHGKIFERFYRRGSELRRETKGIGIGLTLVKQIMEDQGGAIELESSPGHGSRFTLLLPKPSEASGVSKS